MKFFKWSFCFDMEGDKSFIIRSISGGLYPNNLNECLKKKKEIVNGIENSLSNLKFFTGKQKHIHYKNSFEHYSAVYLGKDFINLKCLFWDKKDKKKYNLANNLSVMFQTREITNWVESGYK